MIAYNVQSSEYYENILLEHESSKIAKKYQEYYMSILLQCESNNIPELVEALLAHRPLLHIPGTNILHPYAVKLLYNHNLIILNHDMSAGASLHEKIEYYKSYQNSDCASEAIGIVCKDMIKHYAGSLAESEAAKANVDVICNVIKYYESKPGLSGAELLGEYLLII